MPLPTVHRLTAELVSWCALEREPRRPYRIGLRSWEVASLAPRSLGLRGRAMPFLEDVFEVTRQNVQLAVLDGFEAVYVERLSARGAVGVVTRVGGDCPAGNRSRALSDVTAAIDPGPPVAPVARRPSPRRQRPAHRARRRGCS